MSSTARIVAAVALAAVAGRGRSQPAGTWVQTFFDDFNGTALNASNWRIADNVTQDGGHAIFVSDAVNVSGGNLVITTTAQPYYYANVTHNFTSGWVDSRNHFSQRGGRWEARIQLPRLSATCAWPAWWVLPNPEALCWPIGTEVDILEAVNGFDYQHRNASLPVSIFQTLHYGFQCYNDASYNRFSAPFPNCSDATAPVIDFSADFHVFGVELNDTSIRWYVDDATTFVQTPPPQSDPSFTWGSSPYVPFSEMFAILNVAVADWGCVQPVPPEGWAQPAQMLVDWVRVYQWVPACSAA